MICVCFNVYKWVVNKGKEGLFKGVNREGDGGDQTTFLKKATNHQC